MNSYKEMYLALGSLYIACVRAGLQPSMEFVKISCLSSDVKTHGRLSMREFLMNFEESAFFKTDIEPSL